MTKETYIDFQGLCSLHQERPSTAILTLAQDSDVLISANADQSVVTAKLVTSEASIALEPIKRFEGFSHVVSSVARAPGASTFIAGCWDKYVREFDIETGVQIKPLFRGPTREVTSVAVVGDKVVAGSMDGMVYVWRASDRELLHKLSHHNGRVNVVKAVQAQNAVLSGGKDGQLLFWELGGEPQPLTICSGESAITDLDLMASQSLCAAARRSGLVQVVGLGEPASATVLAQFEHPGKVNCVRFDPLNAKRLAVAGDSATRIYRSEDSRVVRLLAGDEDQDMNAKKLGYRMKTIEWFNASRTIAVGFNDGRIALYDMMTKE